MTLEELKSAEQIVKQKNQETGKNKLNNQVETNNNSTNNIGTPQVSKSGLLKLIFSLYFFFLAVNLKLGSGN